VSIARIGESRSKAGMHAALREFLLSIMPSILSSRGCLSCELFQDQEDPTKFVMIEVWENIEAHQASVKNIPPEKIREIMPLLAGSPGGRYYVTVTQQGGSHGG
jgi:heme oxygenase (mycobilin-producing)